ncbi:MAG TPA: outer membrane protein assembly factor BamD [Caldithrix abyssi]|uniref:Outer membrane protein assembly factor BamD n=1 Tax=Caldithrix abyssi TaxID=187145 RepID=A0A7V1LZ72_CALAY|nr:outer membrane protein assembly factor BamD [Caldithrix abyssi]
MKRIVVFVLLVVMVSCTGNRPKTGWKAEEYYKYAKELFNDEDYLIASQEFQIIMLRFPGSSIADSAQFFLAESHFKMEEYIVASAEYEKLINNMSKSPLVPRAQFQLAESYYHLSPRPALDQHYTMMAIRAYQNFIEDYPRSDLKEKAEKRILELRDKLAEKEYDNAEIYRKMKRFRAAVIYYDEVLDKYYDSEWLDDALYGKALTYYESEAYEDAAKTIEKFKEQFPESPLMDDIRQLESDVRAGIASQDDDAGE